MPTPASSFERVGRARAAVPDDSDADLIGQIATDFRRTTRCPQPRAAAALRGGAIGLPGASIRSEVPQRHLPRVARIVERVDAGARDEKTKQRAKLSGYRTSCPLSRSSGCSSCCIACDGWMDRARGGARTHRAARRILDDRRGWSSGPKSAAVHDLQSIRERSRPSTSSQRTEGHFRAPQDRRAWRGHRLPCDDQSRRPTSRLSTNLRGARLPFKHIQRRRS
jgi:hypothetical protein